MLGLDSARFSNGLQVAARETKRFSMDATRSLDTFRRGAQFDEVPIGKTRDAIRALDVAVTQLGGSYQALAAIDTARMFMIVAKGAGVAGAAAIAVTAALAGAKKIMEEFDGGLLQGLTDRWYGVAAAQDAARKSLQQWMNMEDAARRNEKIHERQEAERVKRARVISESAKASAERFMGETVTTAEFAADVTRRQKAKDDAIKAAEDRQRIADNERHNEALAAESLMRERRRAIGRDALVGLGASDADFEKDPGVAHLIRLQDKLRQAQESSGRFGEIGLGSADSIRFRDPNAKAVEGRQKTDRMADDIRAIREEIRRAADALTLGYQRGPGGGMAY